MNRYGDDPYYVHPEYERGARDRDADMTDLVNYLGTVIDELGAHILKDDGMTDEDQKFFDLSQAALKRINEVL